MQAAPKPPMTRAQKLRWYAEQLISDAEKAEGARDGEAAVTGYLQAADVLLLLAKAEQNYTAWKYYAERAAQCQQRARRLIALTSDRGAPSAGSSAQVGGPHALNIPQSSLSSG